MATFEYFNLGTTSIFKPYDFKKKDKAVKDYVSYMLMRTQSMFDYDGLPDTMPRDTLELFTQANGVCAVIEHEGNIYSLVGGWGGEPNQYYLPTKYVIANPYLGINDTYTVDKDCIIYQNDSLYRGLAPMFRRYATLLVENDLSIKILDVNSRALGVVEAKDDNTRASANEFFKGLEDGENKPIASNAFLESLQVQPFSRDSSRMGVTDLIELEQYLKASWFNEIGLNANYNMKRESINSNEAQLNDDMLTPLIDDMLFVRQRQVEKINDMFGTNISVRLGSAWARNEIEWKNDINGDSDYSENEELEEMGGGESDNEDKEENN